MLQMVQGGVSMNNLIESSWIFKKTAGTVQLGICTSKHIQVQFLVLVHALHFERKLKLAIDLRLIFLFKQAENKECLRFHPMRVKFTSSFSLAT